jgi:uncharacterized protein YjlB
MMTNDTKVRALRFGDDGRIPNSSLPLLLYPGALAEETGDLAGALEERFAGNGWSGGWRNGIYPFHHYHSISHEVLGIARGRATVRFGGEQGETVEVKAGDVVVIPAGVGHRNEGSSPDLLVIGAYPGGCDYDLCRGLPGERPRVLESIAAVPMPATDPVHGPNGPLLGEWATKGR